MSEPLQSNVSQRTLLIVDDQPSVCMALEFLLAGAGYRIVTAGSGPAAIAIAELEVIDGVLIDVHMPEMNGLDTCVRLQARARTRGRELRVWFMTGASAHDLERRSAELGTFGVLRKPFDWTELLVRLERDFASPLPSVSRYAVPASSRST